MTTFADKQAVLEYLADGGKTELQIMRACNLSGKRWRAACKELKADRRIVKVITAINRWTLREVAK